MDAKQNLVFKFSVDEVAKLEVAIEDVITLYKKRLERAKEHRRGYSPEEKQALQANLNSIMCFESEIGGYQILLDMFRSSKSDMVNSTIGFDGSRVPDIPPDDDPLRNRTLDDSDIYLDYEW